MYKFFKILNQPNHLYNSPAFYSELHDDEDDDYEETEEEVDEDEVVCPLCMHKFSMVLLLYTDLCNPLCLYVPVNSQIFFGKPWLRNRQNLWGLIV